MSNSKLAFGKAIPVLASLDIARTLRFFEDVLGFGTRHVDNFSYGIAARGEVEIHFWLCDEKHIAENTSCYVRVDDVYALHAELAMRLPALGQVAEREWGMAELYVLDPDGNLIKFGQPIDGGRAPSGDA
ncbi:bleomycin resistance protein [Burkholderia glumae]|uniref:bleomycin resistance protein n=1 Tax=Burkholderia glumae TaxID=337 RepID=UPI001463D899|nr:VOC family protein [Burkholderia glumae]QJP71372.1 VOC family protein [Burkholderia glumae]